MWFGCGLDELEILKYKSSMLELFKMFIEWFIKLLYIDMSYGIYGWVWMWVVWIMSDLTCIYIKVFLI